MKIVLLVQICRNFNKILLNLFLLKKAYKKLVMNLIKLDNKIKKMKILKYQTKSEIID